MKILHSVLAFIALWATINADYLAAVVEYSPLFGSSPNSTVEVNLNEYIHYIERARGANVQIIVFPEYGLTGLVEDPTNYAIEIPNISSGTLFQNYWLQRLSNSAKEHGMYVVVNLLEKAKNENNATVYHNTNIVFDRNGAIIAKYRKINLFFEPNITPGNETVTFHTDFGIVFGLITCFDIIYYHPSRSILSNSVSDIILTTAWTSTLPFYHSLSVQAGYSQANQVNLLAADLNNPSKGLGGSGIYGSDGLVLSYYISGISSSKLLISNVIPRGTPREESPFTPFGFDILNNTQPESELRNFINARDFQSSKYQFKQLDFSKGEIQETLCHGSYCCNFKVTAVEVNTTEVYQLLVYDGPTRLGDKDGNVKICALVACESPDTSTCGSRDATFATKFSEVTIDGDFPREIDHFYQPVTLTTDLVPVFNTSFRSVTSNESITLSFTSSRNVEKVIVFGIFGRGAASTFGSSFALLVALSILKYLLPYNF